ncbi:MAG TPA: ThiF family adenylyltransferase [Thermoanaerobaculia bacterium]|nr:ThiF family adenylyltransferase [Thermoanaerobaculia bacterium]
MSSDDRHSRHRLFTPIGEQGQESLEMARIAVVGCGALGSRIAELLARAGVGRRENGLLRIIDRDYVDLSNLQRQALFDEEDAKRSRPKAPAAKRHIARIDSTLHCEAVVRDLNPSNALSLLEGVDLIMDGTDNFRTRFLINDAAIRLDIPWIYGAAVGSRGMTATIVPGTTPCLRCFMEFLPPLGSNESCDVAGIITPLPSVVAGLQVAGALKWIVAREIDRGVAAFDVWKGGTSGERRFAGTTPVKGCLSCDLRELPSLDPDSEELVTLCGRNSVQISRSVVADLEGVAKRLATRFDLQTHDESVTIATPEGKLTLFDDGRVIVEGTTDVLEAKTLLSRYLGD